jgi:hypothetical protein
VLWHAYLARLSCRDLSVDAVVGETPSEIPATTCPPVSWVELLTFDRYNMKLATRCRVAHIFRFKRRRLLHWLCFLYHIVRNWDDLFRIVQHWGVVVLERPQLALGCCNGRRNSCLGSQGMQACQG